MEIIKKMKQQALDKRPYKFKNAHLEFFCPLCNTQRAVVTNPHLNAKNYLQVFLITVAIIACTYPIWELKGIFSFFLVWACFEASLRINFRKEVPCPHCGFDASWYKKDVKVAKSKVDEFWLARGALQNARFEKLHTQENMQKPENA